MAIAGLTVSPLRASEASGISPVMRTLSDYMAAAGLRALPAEAAEHTKHHLVDTLAAMISGSQLLPGAAAQKYMGAHSGKGRASIVATALTAAPADAALANGVMGHADETDDSHNASRSHPGCAIVPAALAAG
jgi:2-methylcitrate dehydratase PrpD